MFRERKVGVEGRIEEKMSETRRENGEGEEEFGKNKNI